MIDPHPRLSLRLDFPNGMRFGPGKAALLRSLMKTGSIRSAAGALNMSYPRALKLIDQMNASFTSPVVETQMGGAGGGGAQLTDLGQRILSLYADLCDQAATTNAAALEEFGTFLTK